MHRENVLQEEGTCSRAVPLLRQLIVKEPGMVPLYRKLCQCLILMKEYQQAVVRKLVELNPDSADAHFQLGGALIAVEDFAAAVERHAWECRAGENRSANPRRGGTPHTTIASRPEGNGNSISLTRARDPGRPRPHVRLLRKPPETVPVDSSRL
jgi:hypothetical protein